MVLLAAGLLVTGFLLFYVVPKFSRIYEELGSELPMLTRVLVQTGERVEAGQAMVVMEAMKMENELRAPRAGRVQSVAAREGLAVETGALLVVALAMGTFADTVGSLTLSGTVSGAGWADRENEYIIHGFTNDGVTSTGPCPTRSCTRSTTC